MSDESAVRRAGIRVARRLPYARDLLERVDRLNVENDRLREDRDRLRRRLTALNPWLNDERTEDELRVIPAMMCPEEGMYLRRLAREYYEGRGAIVDAGCLLGYSTAALAKGLLENPSAVDTVGRIHSYDLFKYEEYYMANLFHYAHTELGDLYAQWRPKDGDSLLPIFERNIEPFRHAVEIHAGDILDESWDHGPIELMFVDVAKSWAINDHLIREFFGDLIPGRSLVIHQDYFHFHCFWIHVTMRALRRFFETVDSPHGSTLAFRCVEALPEEVLGRDYAGTISKDEAVRLIDEATAAHSGLRRLKILTAKVRLLARYNDPEAAARVASEIRESPDWVESPDWFDDILVDLAQVEKELPRELIFPGVFPPDSIVGVGRTHVIVEHDGFLSCVPRTVEGFDATDKSARKSPGVRFAGDWEELERLAGERVVRL